MNRATTYDEIKAKEVQNAVISEFGCALKDIVSYPDTDVKRVVVFVLFAFFGYSKRLIGPIYCVSWLYIPKMSELIENRMVTDEAFRLKVLNVLKTVGYGETNSA